MAASEGQVPGWHGDAQPNGSAECQCSSSVYETDLLVVGAGPAGASLACFLTSHGSSGIKLVHGMHHLLPYG